MVSTRIKVGIDVDGVLADFKARFREMALEMLPGRILREEQLEWGFESLGLTHDEVHRVWKRIKSTPNWYTKLGKCKGTEDLHKLERYFQYFFITTRVPVAGDSVEHQTAAWLSANYGLDYPQVIVSENKGPIVRALELEAFLDDKVENCRDVQQHAPNCKVCLKAMPYNAHPIGKDFTTCKDVFSFLQAVLIWKKA